MSEEFQIILDLLDAGSGVGLLILAVILLYRGDIVPKIIVDKIVAIYEERMGVLIEQNKKLFEQIEKYLNKL